MNGSIIRYIIGWVLNIEAVFLTLPCIVAVIYQEKSGFAFLITLAVSGLLGFILTRKKPDNITLYTKEGFVTVALCWIVLSIVGAVPFYISGEIPSIINALFENVSGFTTTGATILNDVESLSYCMLFWRSFTLWIGGMGVLVFVLTVLPVTGGHNIHLLRAESPGHSVGKLVPRVRSTAMILYKIYIVLTIIQIIFLLSGGVNLFDSLTIAFGTAGTGGFGIRADSLASYSAYIQNVVMVFMILFGINFNVYFFFLIKKPKQALKFEELRYYFGVILLAVIVIAINIRGMFDGWGTTVKHAVFQVASIISTTGYTITDYNLWPQLSKTILIILMLIGACSGSTGGGIKLSRAVILFKTAKKELNTLVHSRSVKKIQFCGRTIEHEVIRSINVFIVTYLMLFICSLLLISIDNFDFTTTFTAVISTLNNIGLGLEGVGPAHNFAAFSPLSKVVMMFNMLAGRLEIFPILLLFRVSTWKKIK